jgi:hypothetical protein
VQYQLVCMLQPTARLDVCGVNCAPLPLFLWPIHHCTLCMTFCIFYITSSRLTCRSPRILSAALAITPHPHIRGCPRITHQTRGDRQTPPTALAMTTSTPTSTTIGLLDSPQQKIQSLVTAAMVQRDPTYSAKHYIRSAQNLLNVVSPDSLSLSLSRQHYTWPASFYRRFVRFTDILPIQLLAIIDRVTRTEVGES